MPLCPLPTSASSTLSLPTLPSMLPPTSTYIGSRLLAVLLPQTLTFTIISRVQRQWLRSRHLSSRRLLIQQYGSVGGSGNTYKWISATMSLRKSPSGPLALSTQITFADEPYSVACQPYRENAPNNNNGASVTNRTPDPSPLPLRKRSHRLQFEQCSLQPSA